MVINENFVMIGGFLILLAGSFYKLVSIETEIKSRIAKVDFGVTEATIVSRENQKLIMYRIEQMEMEMRDITTALKQHQILRRNND